jgi:hypothetical protein
MGVSPGEFLVVAGLVGVFGGLAIRESIEVAPRVLQVEALGLATRAKVHWAESWATEGVRAGAAPLLDDKEGKYFLPAEGDAEGAAHFTFSEQAGDREGEILSIRPAFPAGESPRAIVWVCGNAPAPRGFEVRGENRTTVPASALSAACRMRT